MAGIDLHIGFDPASAARAKNLLQFRAALDQRLLVAHKESLGYLETEAQTYMWSEFKDPQGPLENAFEQEVYGPGLSELSNWSPYAFRRNYGFVGMTDSLGRFYRDDFGIAYMEYAIKESLDTIQNEFAYAVSMAFSDVGAL